MYVFCSCAFVWLCLSFACPYPATKLVGDAIGEPWLAFGVLRSKFEKNTKKTLRSDFEKKNAKKNEGRTGQRPFGFARGPMPFPVDGLCHFFASPVGPVEPRPRPELENFISPNGSRIEPLRVPSATRSRRTSTEARSRKFSKSSRVSDRTSAGAERASLPPNLDRGPILMREGKKITESERPGTAIGLRAIPKGPPAKASSPIGSHRS